jgi:hypothetical protein
MHIPKSVFPTAVVAVALGLASPVLAQHRRGGGDGGHGSNRGSESHGQAVPRAAQPPASRPAPAPAPSPSQRSDNGGGRRDNWGGSQPRAQRDASPPRTYPSVRGGESYRNDASRNGAYQNGGNRNYGGHNNGSYNNGYRNYSYRGYGGHGYYSRPPVRFYHPYYSFRPRFSLSFGLWAGYPVPYAYSYYDPFYYGPSYAYPYPATGYPTNPYPANPYPANPYPAYPPQTSYPQTVPDPNSIGVQQGQANLGGLSFDITPSDAQVLVDGNFVGTVGQFSPSSQPLGLSAGNHRIEVEAQGYRTISFDVNIIAGQVLPYQGAMERR